MLGGQQSFPAAGAPLGLPGLIEALQKQVQMPGAATLIGQQQQQALALGPALFAAQAVALAAEHAAAGEGEALITPANAEVPASLLPVAAPAPLHCLFCGGLGTEASCGALHPVTLDGQPAAVHHLCAIWSPGCYMPEGSGTYVNLEAEARRSRGRLCSSCGLPGAAVTCANAWCRTSFHLPCAMGAPGVLLDPETFELYCPNHSDPDGGANSDEEYHAAPTPVRPRRQTGQGSGGTKRARSSTEAQRPRTDWQKKDENTWLKVVPPWWCEQRTVHFATKVFKELFRSSGSAVLVDPTGGEWVCIVQTEARNDNRPQYTLRGAFAELWQAMGICSGDTLLFKRDPFTGRIDISRLTGGNSTMAGIKMEEAAMSELSEPGSAQQLPEASGGAGGVLGSGGFAGRAARAAIRQEATSERGQSMQGTHPNRWMELPDGWAIKTVYKSTLAHQQCPIAGWLFKKLYGRLPGDVDRASMYDPDLDTEFKFDVSFVSAANVHYITGRTFSSWVRDSGLQAGEQIRMRKDAAGRVVIQRVPSERKVRVDFTTKASSRSASLANMGEAAVAGAPAAHGMELASPPTAEALEALDALVAAAGYAGTHGTPAIQAALAGLGGSGVAAAAAAAGLPMSKRQRMGAQADGGFAAELLMAQQERTLLAVRQFGEVPVTGVSLEDWRPSALHVQMFEAVNDILGGHKWSQEEQNDLLRFRAKYAWLDSCGREVAFLTVSQLCSDKSALLEFVRAAGQGILSSLPGGGPHTAAAARAELGLFAAARTGVSPFAAAAAAPAASTPGPAPGAAQQQQQQQQQQQEVGGLSLAGGHREALAAASLELPAPVDEAALALGLEGATSFNMDMHCRYYGGAASTGPVATMLKQEAGPEAEQGETPDPALALGPAGL